MGPQGPPRQSGVLVVWQAAQALVSPEAVAAPSAPAEGEELSGSASISISLSLSMESSRRDAIAADPIHRRSGLGKQEQLAMPLWGEQGRNGWAGRARVLEADG